MESNSIMSPSLQQETEILFLLSSEVGETKTKPEPSLKLCP